MDHESGSGSGGRAITTAESIAVPPPARETRRVVAREFNDAVV
jgi:hypothetical protein